MSDFIKVHLLKVKDFENSFMGMGDACESFCDELYILKKDVRNFGNIKSTNQTFFSFVKNGIIFEYIVKETVKEILNQMENNEIIS